MMLSNVTIASRALLRRGMATAASASKKVVLIDGVRTPFCLASTEYVAGRDCMVVI